MNEADPDSTRMGERPDAANPVGPGTPRPGSPKLLGLPADVEANERAQEAKEAVKTTKDLDNRIEALTGWRANLDGAIDVLKKDNFPTWARNARIADFVDTSSELLAQMTSGRFRFDQEPRISDELAGIVRKASTLSGGGFQGVARAGTRCCGDRRALGDPFRHAISGRRFRRPQSGAPQPRPRCPRERSRSGTVHRANYAHRIGGRPYQGCAAHRTR